MHVEIKEARDATLLQRTDVAKNLNEKPTLVFIVAQWCPHCVALKPPIETLKTALATTGVNILVIELEHFQRMKNAATSHPLINTLHERGYPRGVPFVGMALPPAKPAKPMHQKHSQHQKHSKSKHHTAHHTETHPTAHATQHQITEHNGPRNAISMASELLNTLRANSINAGK